MDYPLHVISWCFFPRYPDEYLQSNVISLQLMRSITSIRFVNVTDSIKWLDGTAAKEGQDMFTPCWLDQIGCNDLWWYTRRSKRVAGKKEEETAGECVRVPARGYLTCCIPAWITNNGTENCCSFILATRDGTELSFSLAGGFFFFHEMMLLLLQRFSFITSRAWKWMGGGIRRRWRFRRQLTIQNSSVP